MPAEGAAELPLPEAVRGAADGRGDERRGGAAGDADPDLAGADGDGRPGGVAALAGRRGSLAAAERGRGGLHEQQQPVRRGWQLLPAKGAQERRRPRTSSS